MAGWAWTLAWTSAQRHLLQKASPACSCRGSPRTAPGHAHRPVLLYLHVCTPPPLTPRAQGPCVPPVSWRLHQDRPSTGHALPRGTSNKGEDWSPTPRPGTGQGPRGPLSEPVNGNQGCLHPAGNLCTGTRDAYTQPGFQSRGCACSSASGLPLPGPRVGARGRVQAGTGSGRSGVGEVGPRLSGLRLVLRRRGDEGVQHPGQQEHRVDVTRGGSHHSPGRAGGRAGSRSGGGFLPQHRVRAGLPGRAAACPASFMMPREQ